MNREQATSLCTTILHDLDSCERALEPVKFKMQCSGASLVNMLTELRSLRQLARISGLSPSYLSQVRARQANISTGAFRKLMGLLKLEDDHE
jgi:hypothetical protein